MRISRVAKVWFGYLIAKTALTVYEDRQASRETQSRVHGYPWPQAHNILDQCWRARPDLYQEMATRTEAERNTIIYGVFRLDPNRFHQLFGFNRPPAS